MTTEEKKQFNKTFSQLKIKIEKDISHLFREEISVSSDEALLDSENLILELNERILKSITLALEGLVIDEYIRYKLHDLGQLIDITFRDAHKKIDSNRSVKQGKHFEALHLMCDQSQIEISAHLDNIVSNESIDKLQKYESSSAESKELQKSILNVQEVSDLTGLSKSTIYKHTANNIIKFSKPSGKKIYFNREDVLDWMMSRKNMSSDEIEQAAINLTLKRKN